MKSTILSVCTLTCLLFASSTSMKAGDEPKMVVGVSVGAGLPMGAYGSTAKLAAGDTTHVNGFASMGFHFNVNAGYYFMDNVGAMLQIGGNMNGFNMAAYKTTYNVPSSSTATATSYYVGSYLVGPTLRFPIGDKLGFSARVLVGLMTVKSTKWTDTYTVLGTTYTTNDYYSSASTFGYNIGAGLKYNLTDKMGLGLNIDYLGGSPNFTTENHTVSPTNSFDPNSTSGGHKRNMSTSLLNISLGFTVGFGS
ncbi:MAG: outer membrane beta-barrel protein [Bacteroidia bacterium]